MPSEKNKVRKPPASQEKKGKVVDADRILKKLREKAQKTQQLQKLPSSKLGVPKGWRKATIVIRDDYHERLKEMSYWEKIPIKDILDAVLESFFLSKEK